MTIKIRHELSPKIRNKPQTVIKTTYEIVKDGPEISKDELEFRERELIRLIMIASRKKKQRLKREAVEKSLLNRNEQI